MKRYIYNRKTPPKLNKTTGTSKGGITPQSKESSDIWSMSSTDALKVDYIDHQPTHK